MNIGIVSFFGYTDRWSLDYFMRDLRNTAALVDAVILHIRSYGGEVTGVAEASRLVASIAVTKPVITYADEGLCSAAYWVAAPSTGIFCAPSAILGSVGCYAEHYDFEEFYKSQGIAHELFRSGERKARTVDGQIDEEERASIQAEVERIHAEFKATVLAHRPNIAEDLLQGQCFDGTTAVQNGFADNLFDSLADLKDALQNTYTNPGETP
jgi:serine protease SohB